MTQPRFALKRFGLWLVLTALLMTLYWLAVRPDPPPDYGLPPACDGVPCANDSECGTKCTCEGFTTDQLGECRAK